MSRSPLTTRPGGRTATSGALGALLFGMSLVPAAASAQSDRETGVQHVDPRWHAFVHATVVSEPGVVIEDATLVIRDGVIVSLEPGGAAPDGARVWDSTGRTIYPAFVEMHLPIEVKRPEADDPGSHYYHRQVAPQRRAASAAGPAPEDLEKWRNLGFAVAATSPSGGLFRGCSAVVSLGDESDELHEAGASLLRADAYQEFSFQTRGFGGRGDGAQGRRTRYPNSEMGAIALIRQTLADVQWHAACATTYARDTALFEPPPENNALEALAACSESGTPFLFDAADELQILRAVKVAEEFGQALMVLGCGTEFRRIPAIAAAGVPLIVPLNYPSAPEVGTVADASGVSLRDLMSWEQAPTNLRRLVQAEVDVALTADKIEDASEFFPNLREAIDHGLDPDQALAMLTVHPARMLGMSEQLGKVAPGMLANLLLIEGELFVAEPELRDLWIAGRHHELSGPLPPDRDGDWMVRVPGMELAPDPDTVLRIKGGSKLKVVKGEVEVAARNVKFGDDGRLRFVVEGEEFGHPGSYAFDGNFIGAKVRGSYYGPDGRPDRWSAEFSSKPSEEEPESTEADPEAGGVEEPEAGGEEGPETEVERSGLSDDVPEEFGTPFGAYGLLEVPSQETVLVVHATIWTCGPEGVLEDAAMLAEAGRITFIGSTEDAPHPDGVRVIDAGGLHLTPGLIDCHSHTGISRGVNETGERVTAEVRIEDVIDPDDIHWYRQLAGGLTGANQLHGSANAIGGQNSVVKVRWGVGHPDDMRLQGAKPGIKFALGENPKRVAQDTEIANEYPKTRMGVETLIRDRLTAGREHRAALEHHAGLSAAERSRNMPPRRDLELEALGEIVAGERLIHCHSYRQDEILMLCLMAGEFGFKIGTFQHVLEGYKVAEAIKEHALGGSTFSDWWAYKFEVFDAIPSNAALMSEVGVVVSINSDSSDFARRLNTEAAKGVKYGGMDPHEALKMVTLNPAIQLAIDDRVGSLEVGKDADFVLWSSSPLSYTARAEATFVDGRQYFSRDRDLELRAHAEQERSRLLQKLLARAEEPRRGRRERRVASPPEGVEGGLLGQVLERLRGGVDVFESGRGDCGCGLLLDEAQLRDLMQER